MAVKEMGLDKSRCVIVEDSEIGLKAARAAGITCLVTKSSYTANENFMGADMVVDELGDDPASGVTLDTLAGLLKGGAPAASGSPPPFAQYNPTSSFAPASSAPAQSAPQIPRGPPAVNGGVPAFTKPATAMTPPPPSTQASPATPATSGRRDFASPLHPNSSKVPRENDPDKHGLEYFFPAPVKPRKTPTAASTASGAPRDFESPLSRSAPSQDPDKHGLEYFFPAPVKPRKTPSASSTSKAPRDYESPLSQKAPPQDPDKHGLEYFFPAPVKPRKTPSTTAPPAGGAPRDFGSPLKRQSDEDLSDPDKHGLEEIYPSW